MNKYKVFKLIAAVGVLLLFAGVFSEPTSWFLTIFGAFIAPVFIIISEAQSNDELEL